MLRTFESVYVRSGIDSRPEVQAFLSKYPEVPAKTFRSITEIDVPGTSMGEKIGNGKRVLVIDKRSGSLLDRFNNHDPGAICPSFFKIVPGGNCVYSCEYCFLQLTFRACRPFIWVYVIDFPKLEKDIRRRFPAGSGPVVVNAGEMSDPLACDVLGNMPRLVEMFAGLDGAKLLLLTKSGLDEIQPLLDVRHNGHTIVSWSVTCDAVIRRYESGNEPLSNRLAAAKAAQDAGYEVRFRIDPMMFLDEWTTSYSQTVVEIYRRGIRPSRFTLGTFRLLGNLPGIIKTRFPQSDILHQPLVKEGGKRLRLPEETRMMLYLEAVAAIRFYDGHVPISLCKETPELWKAFDELLGPMKCNCLP